MEVKARSINQGIDALFKTTAQMIYDTDMAHGDGRNYWPFHPVYLDSFVAPFLFDELYRIFKLLEKRNYSAEKIAKLLESPTKIASYQYLWPIKSTQKLSYEKKYFLAKTFVGLLEILRHHEPFCEKRRNLVWNQKQVNSYLVKNRKFLIQKKKSQEMARLLAKLEGLIMSFCELLYYYMLDFSRMVHGPYFWDKKIVFAKEFFQLQAREMWELTKNFPFDHFQEVGIYPADMKVKVFFMGHTHAQPSFPEALEEFILKVDKKPIKTLSEMKSLYTETDEVVSRVVDFMIKNKNNEEFLLKRGIDLFFYPLKLLYNEVGESWKTILPEVYRFAKKEKAKIKIPGPWGDWSKEKAVNFLIKQMDFRRKHA